MPPAAIRAARRFFRSPRTFFRDHPRARSAAVGFVVVLAFAFALAGSVVYLGGLLADTTDATVTVDNPDRPPEWVCDGPSPDVGDIDDGCDEPETIERDAGAMLREAAYDRTAHAFLGGLLLWPIAGTTLFITARLSGGDGGYLDTLGVAAWAVVPEFLRLVVALLGLRYALGRLELTGPVESYPDQLLAALASLETPLLPVTVVVFVWQWVILTAGLEETHGLSRTAAGVVVGVLLALWGGAMVVT
ncbi:Yip1 family protein [Natrialbaceae archaeon AArc-T1-2]|uniref:Yip1 family protein n=1 Tax=Natrialbaceae archaeon AArc-T1-2 TaxID=3053904 RepID=UPI00255A83B8|nr:Yip1 family protein [Natrialbaceae archaeon AArc-T1-2]WIV67640.1 Yip1 family protein [Natrialbaceae archaeon AArc-T1-2]